MVSLGDVWHAIRGMDEDTEYNLNHLSLYITPEERKTVDHLLKYRKAILEDHRFPTTTRLLPETHYPLIKLKKGNESYQEFVDTVNATVEATVREERIEEFSKISTSFLAQHLAPHILGLDHVKQAVVLQLAMRDRFHILLLGDPGTGKTDILRSACDFAPIHSFGLGSGASKAGLGVSVVGKEVRPGILVQAHGGVCCIDELNLMKADDRAALYNAMEKGFVSYDKGTLHQQFPADIRLLATANPKGDQFRGADAATLRKQLPFEAALLSRFHMVFIIRRPDLRAFKEISMHTLRGEAKPLSIEDRQFIHEYLNRAQRLEVHIPPQLEEQLVTAVTKYKKTERTLLIDVTPRLTKGLAHLARASAALELRTEVTSIDVQRAVQLLDMSLRT
jgi:DNA replicative helicase MCM subunit Mcm2 (Cdc46/Mcm family)